jgi:hypothetical protein
MKTRAALERSIRHWKRIRDGRDRQIGRVSCSLCELFIERDCEGCPVHEHTKQAHCFGTPYTEFGMFINKLLNVHGLHFADLQDKPGQKLLYRRRVLLAQAEIDFLKSLRPKRRT